LKRQIIKIDEDKCTGCGNCIPGCPEGALQLIDGKARLISDLFCDGLGACMGDCPEGAITTELREAEPYDENKVMDNIVKAGANTIKAHLEHLDHHKEYELYNQAVKYLEKHGIENPIKPDLGLGCGCGEHGTDGKDHEKVHEIEHEEAHQHAHIGGCPGAATKCLEVATDSISDNNEEIQDNKSYLTNWPIQINLLPLKAAFYENADLLITADCTAACLTNFHSKFVKGRTVMMGCPKLDNGQHYIEKLTHIFEYNNIKSIHILMMLVPCCSGLEHIVKTALNASGKNEIIPVTKNIINMDGSIKS
jgi:ferredoxin